MKAANEHNTCPKCRAFSVKTLECRGVRFTRSRLHGYVDMELAEIFRQQGIRATRRRKACTTCGHRFTTYEFKAEGLEAMADYLLLNRPAHRRAA